MTRPSSQPMNRSELYRWVMALGFCAYDMLLYLDTHPDDAGTLLLQSVQRIIQFS